MDVLRNIGVLVALIILFSQFNTEGITASPETLSIDQSNLIQNTTLTLNGFETYFQGFRPDENNFTGFEIFVDGDFYGITDMRIELYENPQGDVIWSLDIQVAIDGTGWIGDTSSFVEVTSGDLYYIAFRFPGAITVGISTTDAYAQGESVGSGTNSSIDFMFKEYADVVYAPEFKGYVIPVFLVLFVIALQIKKKFSSN